MASAPIGVIIYAILGVALLALYSSWNRPLWYDEMVYYVLGGFSSPNDVLAVVGETTTNINQGTTGAYMVVDYLMLSMFGAQSWALRLPSLLFGIYFLAAAAVFLRGRGVGWPGLWALTFLLAGQQTLMYYVGEARTYIPLAAAVTGLSAYYFLPLADRRRIGPRLLGWSAVVIGVLFHPYFALYWPLILLFAVLVQKQWRNMVRLANPVLVVTGTALYFAVASATWLRGSARREDLDPYLFLVDPLWRSIVAQLTQAIYVERILVVVVALVFVISAVLVSRSRAEALDAVRQWWPPVVLLVISFLSAMVISFISLQQQFWIIPRQWIASIALSSLAIIWLFSAIIRRILVVQGTLPAAITGGVLGLALFVGSVVPITAQVDQLRGWSAQRAGVDISATASREDLALELDRVAAGQREPLSEDEWVVFSNANIVLGGPVWPEFADYYITRDPAEFVLRD